jgi:hypothetical protein
VEAELALGGDDDGVPLVRAGPVELAQDVGLCRVAALLAEQADLLAVAHPGARRLDGLGAVPV